MKDYARSRKITAMLVAATLLLTTLLSCADPTDPAGKHPPAGDDTPAHITLDTSEIDPTEVAVRQRDFGATLLQTVYAKNPDGNTLISPLSIHLVMTLAACGAKGETREQMEAALRSDNADSFMKRLADYVDGLHDSAYARVKLGDSIWIKDKPTLTVNEEFLQKAQQRYDAEIFREAFDEQTLEKINAWCADKTDDMIPKALDEISPDAALYLINTLLFDAQWEEQYYASRIKEGSFTAADGSVQTAQMMTSIEESYYNDGMAQGFSKAYAQGGYRFFAMLPNEGVEMSDYLAALSGATLSALPAAKEHARVNATLPQFAFECSYELKDVFASLGMTDVFDSEKADLSGMAVSEDGNLFIDRVIHKTAIELNDVGTRAAAVTIVEDNEGAAPMPPEKEYTLVFDRPFVFMIVDRDNIPLFIGVVNSVE